MLDRNNDGTFKRSLVYGVGVDDIYGSKERLVEGKRHSEKYYSTWRNMLKRCYFTEGEYFGKVTVAEDWHTLSNFKTWFDENYVDGYSLDKDILGGKIYSRHTCLFIPQKLNTFIKDVSIPCGSYFDKSRNRYQAYTKAFSGGRINIGRFKTECEAIFYAKTAKMLEIVSIIETLPLQTKVVVGLYRMLDEMYSKFILPKITQVCNCTFLDAGDFINEIYKVKGQNNYGLAILNLRDFC